MKTISAEERATLPPLFEKRAADKPHSQRVQAPSCPTGWYMQALVSFGNIARLSTTTLVRRTSQSGIDWRTPDGATKLCAMLPFSEHHTVLTGRILHAGSVSWSEKESTTTWSIVADVQPSP